MLSLLSITPKIGPSLPWYLYITKLSGNVQEMGKTIKGMNAPRLMVSACAMDITASQNQHMQHFSCT